MTINFNEKINEIKNIFKDKNDSESRYLTLIELGRKLPPLDPELKSSINMIDGCQSTTYLYSFFENGRLHFKAESNALISSGLAALLIMAYDDQPADVIINNPPDFINELKIPSSLSPGRANGLAQMYIRMKQEALKYL